MPRSNTLCWSHIWTKLKHNSIEGMLSERRHEVLEMFVLIMNWQVVRIKLVMSMLFGPAMKQVNYTAAFMQAKIDKDPNWDKIQDP